MLVSSGLLQQVGPALWAAVPVLTAAQRTGARVAAGTSHPRLPSAGTAASYTTRAAASTQPNGGGDGGSKWRRWALGAGAAFAAATAGTAYALQAPSTAKPAAAAPAAAAAPKQLPEYSEEEVAEHRTADSRIWVTYRG